MSNKKDVLYKYLLEQVLSEDIWSDKIQSFKKEGVSKDIAEYYVNKFKEFKNKLNVKSFTEAVDVLNLSLIKSKTPNDINSYASFKDIESLVDYLDSVSAKRSADTRLDIEVDGGKEIYKDNKLVIWLARNRKACIEYSTGYGWCVGRQDSSNMYYTYRFKDYEPTFYFVKDVEKTEAEVGGDFKDKYHFFVVQATSNKDKFIVTSAKNDGDIQMSWSEVVAVCPALKGKRDLFKHIPIEGAEKGIKDKFYGKGVPSVEEFKKMSYEDKEWYLDIAVKSLSDLPNDLFFLLPDELKKKFIGYGVGLTKEMLDYVDKKSDLRKYKEKVGEALLDKYNKGEIRLLKPEQFSYININKFDFSKLNGDDIKKILTKSPIAEKIWDSGKLDLSNLGRYGIADILTKSPIAEKIWDSGKLDLSNLGSYDITDILTNSPIAEKIWDSGKLDLTNLGRYGIADILTKSPIAEKIWDSGKLDLSNLDIADILRYSPIAEKIWDSGKLDLSNLSRYGIADILRYSPIAEKIKQDANFIKIAQEKGVYLNESIIIKENKKYMFANLLKEVEKEYYNLINKCDCEEELNEEELEESYWILGESDCFEEIEAPLIAEAEYRGKKVKLNKPMRGDVKKYKVYVKNDKGNVVKVNFGDPNMRIRRDEPERRKNFRASHKCDTATDKTTPRYWSCKFWSSKNVSDMVS